jgi:hypothetical protein
MSCASAGAVDVPPRGVASVDVQIVIEDTDSGSEPVLRYLALVACAGDQIQLQSVPGSSAEDRACHVDRLDVADRSRRRGKDRVGLPGGDAVIELLPQPAVPAASPNTETATAARARRLRRLV